MTATAGQLPPLTEEPSPVGGISRNVFVLSLVSFAADISTEMIYPVLPIFLTATLGAPVAVVGVIEGIAEGTASVSKVVAGWWSDRVPRRRPLITAGYGLAALGKLLLALSFVWPVALVARFCDRLGKGTRTAPRDALLADSSSADQRGRVFGFHRGLDTVGAVIGPLIGLALVSGFGDDRLRIVFLVALIPAIASVALVSLAHERPRRIAARKPGAGRIDLSGAPASYWVFLGIGCLFAFGNSSDAFLLLRAENLGLGLTAVILTYAVYNSTYALLSYPAGIVSDRIHPGTVLAAGYAIFGIVYLGFAATDSSAAVWPLFALYGVVMAFTEGISRALIANLSPADKRGSFLGLHSTAIGLTAVLASVIAGVLWDQVGPAAPFAVGGVTGLVAAVLMSVFLLTGPRQRLA